MSETPTKINAIFISNALKKRFSDSREYAIAEEVGVTTGGGCRRIDMIVMDCYWGHSFRIDGFEIKISTSDLRRELEDPDKHTVFYDILDYYTLAVPAGVVDPVLDIIPKNWGILIVNPDGSTRYKRKPLALQDTKDRRINRGFMASFVRAVLSKSPAEEELKKQYDKGYEKGLAQGEYNFNRMSKRVKEDTAKLEAYDKLSMRLRIWDDKNIDKILDEFEAYRNAYPDSIKRDIDQTINQLNKLKKLVGG